MEKSIVNEVVRHDLARGAMLFGAEHRHVTPPWLPLCWCQLIIPGNYLRAVPDTWAIQIASCRLRNDSWRLRTTCGRRGPKAVNAQEAADILGVNRHRHGDLLEMLRA